MSLSGYDVAGARAAIRGIAEQTPTVPCPTLGQRLGVPVALKLENLQVTGSFKVRGAANRMLALSDAERRRGVVTCSSGNHGRAVAYVAELLDIPATICVPEWVDPVKLEAIKQHGAEAVLHGSTYDEAEEKSYAIERERGLTYVHPFDDPHVIAGQGTIGLELLDQLPSIDMAVVPLSGGGLISGVAVALKSHNSDTKVVGVSAQNASVMLECLKAGKPIAVEEEATIASALSGGIDLNNRHTFALVRDLVDEHILVSEEDIRYAMEFAADELKLVVEGGGAVGIAAALADDWRPASQSLAIVVSGGNVSRETLAGLESHTHGSGIQQ
ncbi:MAG: threonine/serine dehydratase [Gemmatimonadota bacterium]|nr:MAG: threonine/serine dehydratase [Gemmatimonadota bacterium]